MRELTGLMLFKKKKIGGLHPFSVVFFCVCFVFLQNENLTKRIKAVLCVCVSLDDYYRLPTSFFIYMSRCVQVASVRQSATPDGSVYADLDSRPPSSSRVIVS